MMQKHQPGEAKTGKTGLRVLVVDDDPFYREMAEMSLKSAGYEILTAEDGAQGLEFLRSAHFDLAVIDLTMPGIDGYEVIRRTRSEGQNPNLPIVVMTGTDDVASVEQSFEAGATSFIAKPINWPLFVHHVNFVGRAARAENELRDAVRTVEFLSNLKSKVLSVLVTESQLPLRTAISMAELLRKEVYGPLGHKAYLEYAEDLYRSLDALSATQLKMLNAGRALATELLLQEEVVTLAEIASGLDAEYPPELRDLAAFTTGDASELREKIAALLALSATDRERIAIAARRAVVTRWSWSTVAERLLRPAVPDDPEPR